ncbi:DUF6221 family protein [Kitasatospora sp. NPDC001683]
MSGDLVDWLRAELDRVEQTAQAAAAPDGPTWTHNPGDHWLISGESGHPLVYDEGTPTGEQARHIALWDPAKVLRRVATDRQIIDEHQSIPGAGLDGTRCVAMDACTSCGTYDEYGVPWPCRTIRSLAEGYGWTEASGE